LPFLARGRDRDEETPAVVGSERQRQRLAVVRQRLVLRVIVDRPIEASEDIANIGILALQPLGEFPQPRLEK
jgi:hypothetical protein